jgi:hypothetical protein
MGPTQAGGHRDHRDQPDPLQSQYSSSHDSGYDPRYYYRDVSPIQSRPASRASSDGLQQPSPRPPSQQPLKNALNHAFNSSDAARTVDPELIAQITAEVKKSVLDEIKLGGVTALPQHVPPPPQFVPRSPSSPSASVPSRNVYTPPSPRQTDRLSRGSVSPDPLARDPLFDGADDTPTPRPDRSSPVNIPCRAPSGRPPPTQRMATDPDFTPIEKMWQRLFDPQGRPLPRLGEFLRGLALHLVEDYEPKKSLVISPSKMLKFYDDVKLAEETYPWNTIFGKLSYSTLSKLYRELRCEHHLVQEHPAEQPYVPALTPQGFQEWMTAMIQAYPDAEFERLSKAVLDMPISNAEDRRERFPKELPRRLFPQHENLQAQQRCAAALSAEGVGPLRKAPTFPPPPPMGGPQPSLERERTPYVSQSRPREDSGAVESDDADNEPLSIPIERERKPYAATPGGGKVHNDDTSRSMQSETSFPEQHRKRAQSTASQSQRVFPNAPYPRAAPTANSHHTRSPSFSNYGTKSDPAVRDVPGSYYPPNSHGSEEENRKFARDAEIRRNDWARRQAEEDVGNHSRKSTASFSDSSYDSQPRSVYDDEYYKGRNSTNGYDSRGYERRY